MTSTARQGTDLVVIGGGPAGAATATLVAQAGCQVELFEREHFPRFHVGESLIPETYWPLKRLGMLEKMRRSPFVTKESVQFVSATGKGSAPFYFWDNKPHDSSKTWQVVRSEFDQMMLDNAREHGVQVHEGVRVHDVLFEGDRAVGVTARESDGASREVRARVTVDASGQNGLLMNRLGLRVWDPVLSKAAIWSYWKGARRGAGRDAGATLVIQTGDKRGWFWFIPLHDDLASIGVVGPFDHLLKRGAGYAEVYRQEVAACPGVRDRLVEASQVDDVRITKDYSYRSRRVAGDGWVLVGDAFGFLDPLYSSGVLLALQSAERASDAIVDGLAADDVSATRLGAWGPEFNRGIDRMRRLVCEYYDGFSFGKMLKQYPELRGPLTDLLIGDLFTDSVDRIWQPLESFYEPGKRPIPQWDAGVTDHARSDETDQVFLPEGQRP